MTYSTSRFESAGGAIAIGGGDPVIEYCEFKDNESVYGAAMVIDGYSTDPLIRNNHFHDNNGHGTINIGGGASPMVINNLIEHNHTDGHGNVHFAGSGGFAEIINNTIVNNTCDGQGGAVFVNNGLTPLFINNIIYGNEPAQVKLLSPSSLSFHYCLIEGGKSGFTGTTFSGTYENCIDSDPQFMNSNDFHLQNTSPCIGAGYYEDYFIPLTDFEGNPRPNPMGSNPDIGAYESELGSPLTNVTEEINHLPSKFVLSQNYPNPFNSTTTIRYSLNKSNFARLEIYNIQGERVVTAVNEFKNAGNYSLILNISQFSSGTYFYKLHLGSQVSETRKMLHIK